MAIELHFATEVRERIERNFYHLDGKGWIRDSVRNAG